MVSGIASLKVFKVVVNVFAVHCQAQARPMLPSGGWTSVTFVYCVQTAKDTATVAIEWEQETVSKLSKGTIFNDVEWPLIRNSRSRHYSTFDVERLRKGKRQRRNYNGILIETYSLTPPPLLYPLPLWNGLRPWRVTVSNEDFKTYLFILVWWDLSA